MGDVIIIGAGAAGLSAAKTLSAAGISVCVIEARNRPGGRIHTIRSASGAPIELGAEFVHGRKNEVWEVIKLAQLPTVKVASRRWQVSKGELVENIGFWEHLSRIGATLRPSSQDQSVLGRLDVETGLDAQSRRRMIEFVEGFHAAPIHRMSLKALARANAASERDEGEHSFRVRDGYRGIIEYLMRTISDRAVPVHFESVVKSVRWEPGAVEVRAETPSGEQMFQSEMALITVPLGVLQNAESGMVFKPEPPGKRDAIDALGMGHVTRLSLEFRERFWPEEDFGFVHGGPGPLPTWWTDSRGLILTGWAGGPRAEALNREQPEAWPETAVASLSSIFHVDSARIHELIVACHCQNWSRDPFALGAYSYTPVGQVEAPNRLAEPVANTLFYAGEATDARGEQGTVHAALASGERAAREILASKKGKRSRMNPRAHEQV